MWQLCKVTYMKKLCTMLKEILYTIMTKLFIHIVLKETIPTQVPQAVLLLCFHHVISLPTISNDFQQRENSNTNCCFDHNHI
jgi:hypothetical protein